MSGFSPAQNGQVVQTQQMSTASATSTTSASPQISNVLKAITLARATNKVRISFSGVLGNSNASGSVFCALYRDSTQIGPLLLSFTGAVVQTHVPIAGEWVDTPGGLGPFTYALKIWAQSGQTASLLGAGLGEVGTITLDEIQQP